MTLACYGALEIVGIIIIIIVIIAATATATTQLVDMGHENDELTSIRILSTSLEMRRT